MIADIAIPDALIAAQSRVLHQFQDQVSLLAFVDCFRVLAWFTVATIPLIFAIRHFKRAGKPPAAH